MVLSQIINMFTSNCNCLEGKEQSSIRTNTLDDMVQGPEEVTVKQRSKR